MEIKELPVKDLVAYEKNTKIHTAEQVETIANSIKQFGWKQPIVIDKNGVVVVGHGRLEAAKKLKLKKVPCVVADDLTDDEIRAYRIADNKANESEWDFGLLEAELNEIGIDMSAFGLEINPSEDDKSEEQQPYDEWEDEEDDDGYFGDERERTNHKYNMHLMQGIPFTTDFWQMPIIRNDGFIPEQMIAFNLAYTAEDTNVGVHFYVDDYKFERIWNTPERYIDMFSKFQCILSPDFSLYMDMNMPTKIWNIYRSRWVGAFFQAHGIKVIPTISWAEEETFEFCFRGIPKGSIVSISTIGVKSDPYALSVWKAGTAEMIKQIEPSAILVYGGKIDFDYGDIKVIEYENDGIQNWMQRIEAQA